MDLLRESAERYPTVTKSGRDYLAWAKRIIWRHQQNDRDLLHIQIQFAYEAMGTAIPKSAT